MNSYLSDKIKILSLVSILVVLYMHSGFHAYEIDGMRLNEYVQRMISDMIGRCAVPLFYIISGYLFFYKIPNGFHSIFGKQKNRMRTLLIPYIIASVFFVVLSVLVAIVPGTAQFINSSILPLFENDWKTVFYNIFYNAGTGMPIAAQLWFLRDLIILVILSPIWYLLYKYLRWYWIVGVFVLNYFSINYFPVYALFWFGFGGALVSANVSGWNIKPYKTILLVILFMALCLLQLFYSKLIIWDYIKIPVILLGVSAIWFLYNIVVSPTFRLQNHSWLAKSCIFTFFIYLFHEPTINIVRKLIVFFLGKNETGYLVSYLVSPWIFMIVAVIIGSILKKYVSKLYNIATGGR
ncbi:MAG: acyltransferase [Bacteroidales bacterium]|jgi:peptidoglycan/LPS O-acetylase OafA/YrhL|nr:acyltransferase [Bacteroidales bacterium]